MKLFRCEVNVCATVYVKAGSIEEAEKQVDEWIGPYGRGIDAEGEDLCGLPFDHPLLPDLSLSPAMTIMDRNHIETEEVE